MLQSDGNNTSFELSQTPLHDWLSPRLDELLRLTEAEGFDRDAAVAVMIDLVTGPAYDTPEPPASGAERFLGAKR